MEEQTPRQPACGDRRGFDARTGAHPVPAGARGTARGRRLAAAGTAALVVAAALPTAQALGSAAASGPANASSSVAPASEDVSSAVAATGPRPAAGVSSSATTTSGATTQPAPAAAGNSSTTQQAVGAQSPGGDAAAGAGTATTGAGANGERPARVRKAAASVTIRNFAFSPATVTVRVGETVTWTNADSVVHNAAGNGFRTALIERGQSASYTFTRPGTYRYHCDPHPFMRGTVVVVAAQSGGSGSGAAAGGKAGGTAGSADNGGGAGSGGSNGQQGAGANSPSLPATGAAAGLLALLGAGFVAGGAFVRRAARRLAEHS